VSSSLILDHCHMIYNPHGTAIFSIIWPHCSSLAIYSQHNLHRSWMHMLVIHVGGFSSRHCLYKRMRAYTLSQRPVDRYSALTTYCLCTACAAWRSHTADYNIQCHAPTKSASGSRIAIACLCSRMPSRANKKWASTECGCCNAECTWW